jgi:hypothetical protein
MVGALVAIALVAAIFIILAPAHLTFSIAQANVVVYGIYLPSFHDTNNTHLNFTLTVNNSSPSTVVWYESMAGEVSYGPAAKDWVRFGKTPYMPVGQEPLSTRNFSFSADYGYNENTPNAVESCRILMESKVRFARRGLRTRPYTVRFSCEPVNFEDWKHFPVMCA